MTEERKSVNRRTSSLLPWLLLALTVILGGVAVFFLLANQQGPGQEPIENLYNDILTLFSAIIIGAVGALIVSRRRRHPIGWILLGVALIQVAAEVTSGYSVYGFITLPGALPGALFVAWVQGWVSNLQFVPWILLLLLYPTGHLLSPLWRIVTWVGIVATAALALSFALASEIFVGNGETPLTLSNPIGVIVVNNDQPPILINLLYLFVLVMLFTALLSLILRFRRAHGDERQQLKWFTYAAAPVVVLALLGLLIQGAWYQIVQDIAVLTLPIAIGIAILRYRLYDIDLIIRRTLIYSVLTAILALVYFGGVVLLQELFRALTGQSSEIAIIISTLAIAALFVPLRRRIQDLIDRRFYRRKYDAQKVLAAFGVTVRDEVELDRLTEVLVAVAEETMQPDKVSLWLKPLADKGRWPAGVK